VDDDITRLIIYNIMYYYKMSQNVQQIQQASQQSFVAVQAMMTIDLIGPADKEIVKKMLQIMTSSEQFAKDISSQIKIIMADKKITFTDFPALMMIGMQVESFIKTIKASDINAKELKCSVIDILKYVVYGSICFGLILGKANQETLTMFNAFFPGLWLLINTNPKSLKKAGESLFGK
jgi:hypothetical protein